MFSKAKHAQRHECFSIFAIRSGLAQARLGIVVAKKNVRLAVQRSRVKRMIREAFRLQQAGLSGYDIVVVVKKNFATLPSNFLASNFLATMNKGYN